MSLTLQSCASTNSYNARRLRYDEFIAKFKAGAVKTTDDCYTPFEVYSEVVNHYINKYNINEADIVRPFYPGGDYQNLNQYNKNSVVVDNPPFSILAQIINFYQKNSIKFFLFAPHLMLFYNINKGVCAVMVGVNITYENGAKIPTSYITNLDTQNAIKTAPELSKALNELNKKPSLKPKINFPKNVISAARIKNINSVPFYIKKDECESISKVGDIQIFGGGLLINNNALNRLNEALNEALNETKSGNGDGEITTHLDTSQQMRLNELNTGAKGLLC